MISDKETFGITYIEAISQGIPIIYTKNTGFGGFFEEGIVGYAVNPYNFDDINIAITKIMGNHKFIIQNCINKSLLFNCDIIVKDLSDLYEKTLDNLYKN